MPEEILCSTAYSMNYIRPGLTVLVALVLFVDLHFYISFPLLYIYYIYKEFYCGYLTGY